MPDDPHVAPSAAVAEALGVVHAYHARSKHRLERYAAGPETLDWSAQPDPFRTYTGAGVQLLPLGADALASRWQAVHRPGAIPPQPLNADTLGTLLELTLGLAAWKQAGPDRWAVRCNPSSGNLHPTEGYVLAQGLPGLADGLWHYRPREHALEQRCAWPAPAVSSPRL
ncbi:MAG TPA: nitroreductase, partial [Plasticicumulans sp.]|nr:nitroreductase [Plasticicumulans sp.]